MRAVHVITPGDHFSPSTGSAVPTVVDGLCRFAPPGTPRASVAVGRSTYPNRYDSADVVEYDEAGPLRFLSRRWERRVDAALGLVGLPRYGVRRTFARSVKDQKLWPPGVIVGHNAPQLMPLIDAERHRSILYSHNRLLRTYRSRELGQVLGDVSAIVCVSDWLASQESRGLPRRLAERVRVVHSGVDFGAFHQPRTPGRRGPLTVTFIGRMIRDKGADVLLEAVRRLRRDDIRLVLIGSAGFDANAALDAYEREVRTVARTLRGPVEVIPFVRRAEVVRLLQGADVVVVPSRWPEPFALTVLEGMAAGAAVIGSRIGGIPEAMGDAGVLVRPDDPDELAHVLEAFADDDRFLALRAASAVEHARSHDWAWASAQFHQVIQEVSR